MRTGLFRALVLAGALAFTPWMAGAEATVFIDTSLSCAKYIEAVRDNSAGSYNSFITAFMSGANWVRDRVTPNDAASYRVWVNGYCQQRPFEPFIQAVGDLEKQFGQGEARVIPPAPKK
jgi:hypothetical protein